MIGRLRDDKVRVFGVRTARGLRRRICQCNRTTDLMLDFVWEVRPNSDHYPLFLHDVPVLMLHTGLHDDYHRPSDDVDKINHEGATRVSRFLFAVLADAADRPQRPAFRPQSRYEGAADRQRFEAPRPPRPPRLGVSLRKQTDSPTGIVLTSIRRGSPAERAGLQAGDRLLRFGGREVEEIDQFRLAVLAAQSPVTITVQRGDDQTVETEIELDGPPLRLGFSWREEDAEPSVVWVSRVVAGSAADRAGLSVGDRILQIDDRDFQGSDELSQVLPLVDSPLELLVERKGRLRNLILEAPSTHAAPATD
jgi:predicted metalloprotease with PDZ domain